MGDLGQLAEHIRAGLGASVAGVSVGNGYRANAGMVEPVIKFLRDDPDVLSQLIDLCGLTTPEACALMWFIICCR